MANLAVSPFDFDRFSGGPGGIILASTVVFVAPDTNKIVLFLCQFREGHLNGFIALYCDSFTGAEIAFGGVLNLVTGCLAVFLPGQRQFSCGLVFCAGDRGAGQAIDALAALVVSQRFAAIGPD